MKGKVTGKSIVKDMEHLLKLLHKEWERSGRKRAKVTLGPQDALIIRKRMAGAIAEKQKQLEQDGLTFRQSMALSKENFVLLRLIKIVKEAEDKKGAGPAFSVELDKEEYRLFRKIIRTWED